MKAHAHIIAGGLVQGVGFRYFVYSRASYLGLLGYVRNLLDGSVEVVVEGERASIELLIEKIRVGPRAANVRELKIEWDDEETKLSAFEIR